ncbi:hypothetical protein PISMIDRAFT_17466 [Pisolithus microcarpus 441]|uniref:Uncharacterized protein n=1 Tax=Pisolithus microcarpus 441 TaxID=765257 RepID=A0A0C9YBH9_9AGAM|nr:hypothetical protein PISMIDRAFT_17466 [Pisolithus microcarpus 441]
MAVRSATKERCGKKSATVAVRRYRPHMESTTVAVKCYRPHMESATVAVKRYRPHMGRALPKERRGKRALPAPDPLGHGALSSHLLATRSFATHYTTLPTLAQLLNKLSRCCLSHLGGFLVVSLLAASQNSTHLHSHFFLLVTP